MMEETIVEKLIKGTTHRACYLEETELRDGTIIGMSYHLYPHFFSIQTLLWARNLIDQTLAFYKEVGWTDEAIKVISGRMADEAQEKYSFQYPGRVRVSKPKKKPAKKTNIYIIRDAEAHSLKVGESVSPEKRLRSLQTTTPHALELLSFFEGQQSDEKIIHGLLKAANYHLAREWFVDTPKVIQIVENYFKQ